jgi:hypothetical protein
MFIEEIKAAIAQETNVDQGSWMMARQMELGPDGKPTDKKTEWLSHWDDKNRIRVSMHQDVMEAAKTKNGQLAYKRQEVAETKKADGSVRAAYVRYVIITPLNVEAVF